MKLTGADRLALRALREVVGELLSRITSPLISGGRVFEARRVWDGLNVIERLLGDPSKGTAATLEQNVLTCYRVAIARGWSLAFNPDGDVFFTRDMRRGGKGTVRATGLLSRSDGVADEVAGLLDKTERAMREAGTEFDA